MNIAKDFVTRIILNRLKTNTLEKVIIREYGLNGQYTEHGTLQATVRRQDIGARFYNRLAINLLINGPMIFGIKHLRAKLEFIHGTMRITITN